jgi:pimeloyl-ACP methyl ester carboxylesterase
MIHLGTAFAKAGMNSYLIDLPGHGESTGKFTWENCQGAVQEALMYFSRRSDAPSPPVPVILVGHSMGAALAIQAARYDQSVANVVAVSPVAAQVDRTAPRNLLILLGEFDLPFVRRGAIFLFQQATGISSPPLKHFRDCASPDGSKRMVLLPWTEHSLGIFRPRALLEMANWLEHLYPQTRFDIARSRTELLLKLFICSIVLYVLVPGFDLLHGGISLLNAKRSCSAEDKTLLPNLFSTQGRGWLKWFPPLWLYGLAGILSVALLLAFNPWDGLCLMGGGYLCGFLCLTGVLALCCQRPRAAMLSCSWVDLVTVILSVVLFVYLAGPLFSRLFVHLAVSQARFWKLPIIAVSIYPFYLYDEWVSRHWITSSNLSKLLLFHFSTRLFLALVLIVGFFVLQNRQFLIVLILPAMLALTSLCWFQAWGVYRKTRSVTASAALSALLTAWFLSMFFVQV